MRFTFKVTGLERKLVAWTIANTAGEQAKYSGAPSFEYTTGGWIIGKQGIVTTPETGSLRTVFDALKVAGASTEGNLTVTMPMDGHTGNTLRNLANLIWTKQVLIQKAFTRYETIIPSSFIKAINAVPIDTLEDFVSVVNNAIEAGEITGNSDLDIDLVDQTIGFNFFNATLDVEEINAYGVFCRMLNEQSKKQKSTTIKQKEIENEKYEFRCYLLKLGFIGEEFKAERKILLARLSGDGAFRTDEARKAAEAKRKGPLTEGSES